MEEEFDFDKVGKRMPYKVPSGFFNKITEETLAEAENRAAAKKKTTFGLWQVLSVAASVAVLLTVGYFMYTGRHQEHTDKNMIVATEPTATEPTEAPVADAVPVPEPEQPVATVPEQPKLAVVPKPKTRSEKVPEQQQAPAQTENPETLDEILASISDEDLLQLAALAETDLYVYEQTIY